MCKCAAHVLAHSFGAALGCVVAKARLLLGVGMKRGVASQGVSAKRAKPEQAAAGALWLPVAWAFAQCVREGLLEEENQKLEFALEAIEMDDPFVLKQQMHSDIMDCLMCACCCSVSHAVVVGVFSTGGRKANLWRLSSIKEMW